MIKEGECVGTAGVPGFILGAIVSALILIFVPKLHSSLRSFFHGLVGSRRAETEADDYSDNKNQSGRSDHYTEIDERKTRTFALNKSGSPPEGSKPDGQGYEDCIVGGKGHRYSQLEVTGNNKNDKMTKIHENYEAFSPGKQACSENKRVSNHEYFILEPGSDKRLPVKMLENKSGMLYSDPSHVYFILEPGTNRVTPVPQNLNAGKSPTQSTDGEQGHIYFVLEPMAETADSDTLAYAVNDVSESHPYFILEKNEVT